MRYLVTLFAFLSFPFLGKSQANTWLPVSDFGGSSRMYCVSFSINNQGYVALGSGASYQKELWKFDPVINSWSQCADFPGNSRVAAAAFTLGSFAFVGGGCDSSTTDLNDFWKYSSATNQWTPIAPFPGTARSWAVAFALYNRGYVGCGRPYLTQVYFSDFWEYIPLIDSWSQVASIPLARSAAASFTINNQGYVLGGFNWAAGAELNDAWKYDPLLNLWSPCANIPGMDRACPFAFASKGYGYCGCGGNLAWDPQDCYRYDPIADAWSVAPAPPGFRICSPTFVCNDTAYLGMGQWTSVDFWKFYPDSTLGFVEHQQTIAENAFPNPATTEVHITISDSKEGECVHVFAYDVTGSLVREETYSVVNQEFAFKRNELPSGQYLIRAQTQNKSIHHAKVFFR